MRKLALVALCTTAVVAFAHSSARASDINLSGSFYTWTGTGGDSAMYGSEQGQNNVVNSNGAPATNSSVNDLQNPGYMKSSKTSTNWQTGNVTTSLTNYTVQWYYVGNEAGNTIQFNANGNSNPAPVTASNINNNCSDCGYTSNNTTAGATNLVATGHYTGASGAAIPFSFTDISTGSVDQNTSPGPNTFIFSYLDPTLVNNVVTGWTLCATPGSNGCSPDWFIVGYNDNGSTDDNHDDMMMVGFIQNGGGNTNPTPLPGALPLFGSVLGGGFLFKRYKKRRKVAAA